MKSKVSISQAGSQVFSFTSTYIVFSFTESTGTSIT